MKSMVVSTLLFSISQLLTQAAILKPKDALTKEILEFIPVPDASKYTLAELISELQTFKNHDTKIHQKESITLKTFTKLISGLQTLKTQVDKIKHQKGLITLETFGFSKLMLENCDYIDIENKFEQLVNATVDFLTNVSVSLESICNLLNTCANKGLFNSIKCFLSIIKNCQSDIANIQEDLQIYIPVANALVDDIADDVAMCYHW